MTQPKYDETRVARFRASLQDSSIADLVDAAAMARYELETAKRIDALFSDALYQRRGEAAVLDGTDSVAEMSQGQTYEWNGEAFRTWLGLTTGDHFSVVGELIEVPAHIEHKVDTRKALSWAKKHGLSKPVAQFYTTTKTAPRWEYSDKAKKEETS